MHAPDSFRTARLIASRIIESDFADLFAMYQDPVVMATLGGVNSAPHARRVIAQALEHWDRYGYGIWVLRQLGSGSFAGRAGLRNVTIDSVAEIELLYALRAELWGRCLATEISEAILTIAFRVLHLESVVAFTLPTNRASRRVMEKSGFTYQRDILHDRLPHVLYRVAPRPRR